MESILEQPSQPLPASRRLDSSNLHLLPCGIKHDGKANVSEFFILANGDASVSTKVQAKVTSTTTKTITVNDANDMATTTVATTVSAAELTTMAARVPEASFRGRALKGTVVQVPPKYVGSIYTHVPPPPAAPTKAAKASTKSGKDSLDMDQDEYEAMLQGFKEERKAWTTSAQFDSFMLWGHDHAPSVHSDKVMKAMEWINIAQILHQPIV